MVEDPEVMPMHFNTKMLNFYMFGFIIFLSVFSEDKVVTIIQDLLAAEQERR